MSNVAKIVDSHGKPMKLPPKEDKSKRGGCPGCGASTETKLEALGGVSYCKECFEQLEGKQ